MRTLKKTLRHSPRRGAAVAEMAICLPFVFIMVAGAIELSSGLYAQMTFRSAVHECASRACAGPTTCDDVQVVAQQIMSQIGVTEFDITIDEVTRTVNEDSVESGSVTHFDIPATGATTVGLNEVPRGTIMRLRMTASRPATPGISVVTHYLNNQISAHCVFVKER